MKTFVVLIGLLLASGVLVMAAPEAAPPAPIVNFARCPLTVVAGDYDLLTIVQDFPPGALIGTHRHGGYLLITVMSGAMTLRESGGDRVVKAGESFTESPGRVHSVVNAGPGPARIAVSVLLPKGAEITTMVPD